MAAVKAWKVGLPGAPYFPEDFEIVKKAVLQVTDIKNNNNKYYAIELHQASEKETIYFRVFTHYGRTDDLEKNPEAGQKECRFFDNLADAQDNYDSIYREKTSPRKGYKELSLPRPRLVRRRRAEPARARWTTRRWPRSRRQPLWPASCIRPCKTWCATSTTRRRRP